MHAYIDVKHLYKRKASFRSWWPTLLPLLLTWGAPKAESSGLGQPLSADASWRDRLKCLVDAVSPWCFCSCRARQRLRPGLCLCEWVCVSPQNLPLPTAPAPPPPFTTFFTVQPLYIYQSFQMILNLINIWEWLWFPISVVSSFHFLCYTVMHCLTTGINCSE